MTFYFPIGLGNCSDDVTCFFGSILDKYTAPHETGEVKKHRFHAEIVSFSICGSSPQTYVTLVDFGYPRPFGFLLPKTDLELCPTRVILFCFFFVFCTQCWQFLCIVNF
jgi:hypothetical protein